ncbi:chromate transporter [Vulcanococcus limneticus]|uniref:chromate transporter n=1 Tax=Vulcanococcus limneticus TaxID=2170428 RepID=UPI00398BEF1C
MGATPLESSMTAPVSFRAAARYWLQLGFTSFGGPAGQVATIYSELVERRRWLSERRYLHALNYCMLLPGPEATQLATYIGWLMHGTWGGLVAGALFVLPGVAVLIGLSTIYVLWGQLPLLAAVFWALKPAVVAIVLQAAWRVGSRTLHTPALRLIALAAFLGLSLLKLPYPLIVATAALSGALLGHWRPALITKPGGSGHGGQGGGGAAVQAAEAAPAAAPSSAPVPALHDDHTPTPAHGRFSRRSLAVTLLVSGLALSLPLALLSWADGWDGVLATMARFFTKVALLSFGGAYAVLPYVAQGAVENYGWLSAAQMVDGLALGETTPGPLILVVAFVGFLGGWQGSVLGLEPGSWWAAAAAALTVVWFTFLPSFSFILAGAPLVEASRNDLRLGAPLTAITAAVVGVIATLALLFTGPVLWPQAGAGLDWGALAILVLSALALLRWRWRVMPLIGTAAAVGAARWLLGLGLALLG